MKKKKSQKNRSLALVLVLLFALVAAFCGGVIYYQVRRAPKAQTTTTAAASSSSESSTSAAQKEPAEDAKTYYSQNAKKVLAVIPANSSKEVYSEKVAGRELTARGFGNTPVTYEYNMDGSLVDKTEVDSASSTAHPQYTATYQTKSGDYWTITVCNNCITAYPVTYNLDHNSGAEVILAEGDSITAYDSATNSFYEVIPKPDVLVLKHIPAITAEALDKLTPQEIDAL